MALALASVAPPTVAASEPVANTPGEVFTQGQFGLDFRYRFENVSQDSFDEDALASTLRARANFRSGAWRGLGFFAEYDYVQAVGWDNYNAGAGNTPNRVQYPVVADPEGGDLNQAYLQWRSAGGTRLQAGRERIIYDNHRFVGNVGWRQNEQTFDGVYLQHEASGFDLHAAWVGQVNRIFGPDVPDGRHDNNTWLLNLAKKAEGVGKFTLYYYDIDDRDTAAFSTLSYGLRLSSEMQRPSATIGFTAEFAHQTDAHDNPVNYSADYFRLDLSATLKGVTPYFGFESLGGDEHRTGAAFRTPLATLHAFNGWADKFLNTPDAGLDDLFLGVKGKLAGWAWNVLYHDFGAQSGGADFGNEIDASLGRPLAKRYDLLLKGAWFNGAAASSYDDTTKLWVQIQAAF